VVLGETLSTTAVMQLKLCPDDKLYAATHGRGVWSLCLHRPRHGRSGVDGGEEVDALES